MNQKKIKELARLYPRVIRWSAQDNCFIGSLPDLDGDCTHGDTPEQVAKNLDECAEMAVEDYLSSGEQLPPVRSKIVLPSSFRNRDNNNEIVKLRETRGISQQAFASLLGISLSTLTKWETGARKPSGSSAKLLEIIKKHPELV